MVATLGKLNRAGTRPIFGLVLALLWVLAVGPFSLAPAQTSMQKRAAKKATSPFNLNAGPNALLQGNLVQCGINNEGDVCTDVFDSPTGGGGFWPSGTTNQYIFNSGLQIAGINSAQAGPWANDTVGAYFFDARGTQAHGTPLTDVFNSLNPTDLANWPESGFVTDTAIFNSALIGSKTISDQDSYVEYWDGDPNRLSGRTHPMGIKVQQRSLAFNAPSGAEHTIFFIYRFTNVTNDPAFQQASEQRFNVSLPDAGWTINNIYAAFAMDPDVTTHAGDNFSTAILPINMGIAYHATFVTDDFNFAARADLYAPPFFQGPGFVGVKYLRSPAGLSMFSNTTNGGVFPDPLGVRQLFRYLKGDVSTAAGDPVCTIPSSITARLCALVQTRADTRFFQASGPFSLPAGGSSTIVVGYTHAAPVRVAGYTPGTEVQPGIPARLPGVGADQIRLVERMAGLIQIPQSALVGEIGNQTVNESALVLGRDFVRRSLFHHGLIAQSIYNNKFLLPRPPEPPTFSLVPGDEQVTVVWAPSGTDVNCVEGAAGRGGDPFFVIASNTTSPLYNPNYRRCDVEGYRVYRATGLSGGFELVAQFDKTGTFISDVTCELDPTFVPEEGEACTAHDVEIRGDVVQFFEGGRIRDAVSGSVQVLGGGADTVSVEDTGVPFAFVDRGLRNGVTYRYQVTAFDVNSLRSGAASLESPRVPQFVTPRKDPTNMVFASFTSSLTGQTGGELNTAAADPTISSTNGTFSGPQAPSNGISATFSPLVERLLPAFNLVATVDSVIPYTIGTHPSGCPAGSSGLATCWRIHMSFNRDGTVSRSIAEGFTPVWDAFGDPLHTEFTMGSAIVPPDATAATQFGLPSNFPGFGANLVGTFAETILYSTMEGQTNRRATVGNTIYPGFGTGARHVAAGSRWFAGANETVADPTRLIRVGSLTTAGVDTVWAPIHHTPTVPDDPGALAAGTPTSQYAASGQMQCFSYFMAQMGRAADVRFVFGANGAVTVTDVTHNTPVIFKPTAQVSYGFLNTDANGNGVIDWADFHYIENISPMVTNGNSAGLGCGHVDVAGQRVRLENTARINDVSTSGTTAATAKTATGRGFGLYVNGERYIFQMTGGTLPGANTTWTLRTYSGILRAGTNASALSNDPTGYSFRGDVEPRPPMVTGLKFTATSSTASGPQGEADITQVHTVPDPYYVRSAFELGPSNKVLRFVNLPPQAIIRIYTLNGTLVDVIEHNDALGGAEASWDLRNRNNQFVASGVYFYVVEAANGKKHTGKFTVVQFAR